MRSVAICTAAAEDKPVLANLIQLYLYDMTDDLPFPIGRDGNFQNGLLDRFWQHPYLIFEGNELAGFALVLDGSPITGNPDRSFMAEFFVLRAYRGRGIGTAAFENILRRHKGPWQIAVLSRNKAANAFWSRTTGPYKPRFYPYHFDGDDWLVYEFEPCPDAH